MTKIDTGRTGIKPPEIPSKWDIIPIHASDRSTFKNCRRRWSWSSPSTLNLIPRVSILGIQMPLWFGTGIHHCLEGYYRPGLSEDPVALWEAWYSLQWNGGLVHESELSQFADRNAMPHKTIENTYVVQGLKELMPDPDEEEFEAHRILGIGMMEFYKDYAPREDNFSVIMVESDFSVPIRDEHGKILHWIDNREMPNDYAINTEYARYEDHPITPVVTKQVHARGRRDLILQDNDTGAYGLLDNKTAARVDDDYFRHLDLDEQVTTYWWAAEREAEEYDLEYRKVDFFIYNALRKAFPRSPTMTSKGLPSIDRQKESTTAAMFEKCIKDNNLQIVFDGDEKLQSYYAYLVEAGDKVFIQRDIVRRNKTEIENFGIQLYNEAIDMLDSPRIYPNPTKDYSCLNCVFRPPCKAANAGYDVEDMLYNNYASNYDR